jgi:hypothetical protein
MKLTILLLALVGNLMHPVLADNPKAVFAHYLVRHSMQEA